jgi:predicted Rossmann-fold nucleotide-binding protein
MSEVSRAFVDIDGRAGCVIGIVPTVSVDPLRPPVPGYPNPWVEIPIYTHLGVGSEAGDDPTSRNHINVLTSSAIILLPGGEGTASEARLTLRYRTPAVAYLESPAEIPSLPDKIPMMHDFAEIANFVTESVTRFSRTAG